MIKYEFQSDRRFKLPDEYECYDSDEQDKRLCQGKFAIDKDHKKAKERRIEKEDRVLNDIHKVKLDDDEMRRNEEKIYEKIKKEDYSLELYIRNEVKSYYKRHQINNETPSVYKKNKCLKNLYAFIKHNHSSACERRFPEKIIYGSKNSKKHYAYPKEIKNYFDKLFNRLFINNERISIVKINKAMIGL